QEALAGEGDRYGISLLGQGPPPGEGHRHPQAPKGQGTGVFYCPMQCEGDRTYGAPGDCPVCGMDLVEEQNLSTATGEQWTCPMHPEVVQGEPGACPICGMDLVPIKPGLSSEEQNLKRL